MLLGQLIARGTSLTDIAPKPIQPSVPSNRSNETYSLYCSRCSTSLAARPQQGARSRHHAGTTRLPSWVGWEGSHRANLRVGKGLGVGDGIRKCHGDGAVASGAHHPHPLPFQLPAPHSPFPGSLLPGERCGSRPFPTCKGGLEGWLGRQRVHGAWENAGGGMGTELSPPEQRQRRSSQLQHCPCAGGLQHLGLPHGPTVFPLPLST